MTPRDLAHLFLEKAAQDEGLLDRVLDDPGVADDVIGFHGQQAAEKLLKAVLASHAVQFRKTHDLAELSDLLSDSGLPLPPDLSEMDRLTPFAVDARYILLPATSPSLDRRAMREMLRSLRGWAEGNL